jgi:vitamin K-dependent gamma-carboxylase
MGFSAFLVMLGLFYRVSIVVLTVTFGYFFLLDKAEYLNHFYLVILFLILMCFLPAHRQLSLDARLRPSVRSEHVPYASVFILRAQMEIMLIFAGLVKLTPDWLAGEPLGLWLRARADEHVFGFLFHHDWVILAGTWGTVALHVLGAPLLLWEKTRLPTFVVYCVFHSLNAVFFNIGIFPWLTIAATTIFFAPDWPLRAARWLHGRFEDMPALPAHSGASAQTSSPRRAGRHRRLDRGAGRAPVRAGFFPTEVRWSGDGHRFSWRMRIYDRQAEGRFIVTAQGRDWIVDPEDYLTRRQAGKMMVRSDMIHQFANHLEDVWREAGHADVVVRPDHEVAERPPDAALHRPRGRPDRRAAASGGAPSDGCPVRYLWNAAARLTREAALPRPAPSFTTRRP